jgi:hypothetical protein
VGTENSKQRQESRKLSSVKFSTKINRVHATHKLAITNNTNGASPPRYLRARSSSAAFVNLKCFLLAFSLSFARPQFRAECYDLDVYYENLPRYVMSATAKARKEVVTSRFAGLQKAFFEKPREFSPVLQGNPL